MEDIYNTVSLNGKLQIRMDKLWQLKMKMEWDFV